MWASSPAEQDVPLHHFTRKLSMNPMITPYSGSVLIGLPPTPEEIDDFVHDSSPDAFSKVVDRLLGRPQYGERWGRYWLDVARYAEDDTHGWTKPFLADDPPFPPCGVVPGRVHIHSRSPYLCSHEPGQPTARTDVD